MSNLTKYRRRLLEELAVEGRFLVPIPMHDDYRLKSPNKARALRDVKGAMVHALIDLGFLEVCGSPARDGAPVDNVRITNIGRAAIGLRPVEEREEAEKSPFQRVRDNHEHYYGDKPEDRLRSRLREDD